VRGFVKPTVRETLTLDTFEGKCRTFSMTSAPERTR
jgi:hypothetical protein